MSGRGGGGNRGGKEGEGEGEGWYVWEGGREIEGGRRGRERVEGGTNRSREVLEEEGWESTKQGRKQDITKQPMMGGRGRKQDVTKK